MTDTNQKRIGSYTVTSGIARSGVGEVYEVRGKNGARYAVKLIRAEFAKNPKLISAFYKEIKLIKALNHENIVRIHDSGTAKNRPYLVMDLYEKDLAKLVADHRTVDGYTLDIDTITDILEQIASAMDFVHTKGIIHKDIKAENILIGDDGRYVITDFGIARLANVSTGLSTNATSMGVTGTFEYLAPELWNGEKAQPTADVYAMGVLLFLLLTGQLPFTSRYIPKLMQQHMMDTPPDVTTLREGLHPSVNDVIQTAMEKDPARRFETTGEMVEAFKQALRGNYHRTQYTEYADIAATEQSQDEGSSGSRNLLPFVLAALGALIVFGALVAGGMNLPIFAGSAAQIPTIMMTETPSETPTRNPQEDDDGDGVINGADICPDIAGDTDDGCPNSTATPTLEAQDSDGDGRIDTADLCPNLFGDTDDGCPNSTATPTLPPQDSDGDGRVDSVDACPFEPADTADGCPLTDATPTLPPQDSDGDGRVDSLDACPFEAADTADGCPLPDATPTVAPRDSDGDGRVDEMDACPYQGDQGYGMDNTGCPLQPPTAVRDSDGDGVRDDADFCPTQGDIGYGLSTNGCPIPPQDTDRDGIYNNEDACPTLGDQGYGVDSRGCPNSAPNPQPNPDPNPQPNPDPGGQQFTIYSQQEWQSTTSVSAGQQVSISYVNGQWRTWPQDAYHGPDGGPSPVCSGSGCVEPLPGYPKGGLIGRIGNNTFFVGSGTSFISTTSGTLQMRINDVGVYDNEGAVTMSVAIGGGSTSGGSTSGGSTSGGSTSGGSSSSAPVIIQATGNDSNDGRNRVVATLNNDETVEIYYSDPECDVVRGVWGDNDDTFDNNGTCSNGTGVMYYVRTCAWTGEWLESFTLYDAQGNSSPTLTYQYVCSN